MNGKRSQAGKKLANKNKLLKKYTWISKLRQREAPKTTGSKEKVIIKLESTFKKNFNKIWHLTITTLKSSIKKNKL